MKTYDVRSAKIGPGDPHWIIVVAEDEGEFSPMPDGVSYTSREEAETEANRLELEENGKDGP